MAISSDKEEPVSEEEVVGEVEAPYIQQLMAIGDDFQGRLDFPTTTSSLTGSSSSLLEAISLSPGGRYSSSHE